jgi:hypothetical protein
MANGSKERRVSSTEARRELDHLYSLTYEELRRLASSLKRSDPGITLSPTALVNEAWLKLSHSPPAATVSPTHFKRIGRAPCVRFWWRRRDVAKR